MWHQPREADNGHEDATPIGPSYIACPMSRPLIFPDGESRNRKYAIRLEAAPLVGVESTDHLESPSPTRSIDVNRS
jgi:hypothetical protein